MFILEERVWNFVSIMVIHNFVNGRIVCVRFECAFWNKDILLTMNGDWNYAS
jgi:hypothetical protein